MSNKEYTWARTNNFNKGNFWIFFSNSECNIWKIKMIMCPPKSQMEISHIS